ncbi:efflux RND transporter periplasmic adaptor subunit [Paraglaciecola arctica]|uniref:Secretion protein HlyD n=1 Tax=Paraglaciecola arctica BSs20135 TaxID=493475 RepID=K6Y9P1_9ALTE|nr:HlyD family efflux transporter periplasmic adaptor subunit [Paraglaciecola arctica]GAC20676.1 secretion protein HlyD [Paraglaciecola arctica BSs20135]
MNKRLFIFVFLWQLGIACALTPNAALAESSAVAEEPEPEKGPNNGRMLRDGDFAVELSIFETGVPPEFRVWVTQDEKSVAPQKVQLNIKLTRLGKRIDDINFRAEGDYLRGDTVIYEPHSFVVSVSARHQGKPYTWQYDNFEGRTLIQDKVAKAMEIDTEIVSAASLHKTIKVYGKLVFPANAKRQIKARFEGEIKQVHVGLGDTVKEGQLLLTIESNESLQSNQIKAPIAGVITEQLANSGEQTGQRILLEITQPSKLIAELAVFPMDFMSVKQSAPVTLMVNGQDASIPTAINGNRLTIRNDQARLFLAEVDNSNALLSEGTFVSALIEIDTFDVPLAVKRVGLQAFRDFTVVYAKVGEQYEVRMLELGREAGEWVEVLGGIDAGTEYVTNNSYIIKADIEKSGASHDH